MTPLREAAQQALEALEDFRFAAGFDRPLAQDAIDALRAALAQQDEPEAYGYASRLAVAIWEKHYKDTAPQWKPLDDLMGVLTQIDNMTSGLTLLAQQDEPAQEPVAWIDALKDAFFEGFTSVATYNDTLLNSPEEAWENYKPPRAAPPQRKPLTEEVAALTAQRDALLEALRDLVQLEADGRTEYESAIPHWDAARAAIKAVEETK